MDFRGVASRVFMLGNGRTLELSAILGSLAEVLTAVFASKIEPPGLYFLHLRKRIEELLSGWNTVYLRQFEVLAAVKMANSALVGARFFSHLLVKDLRRSRFLSLQELLSFVNCRVRSTRSFDGR